jgi:hypothetical protein
VNCPATGGHPAPRESQLTPPRRLAARLAGGFPGNTQSPPQSAAFGPGFVLLVLATPLARAAVDSPRAISESAWGI